MSTDTLVKPYHALRGETLARDRGLREKVMSLEEAAKLVHDGEHVGIGGCTMSRTPMAMIWALIRAAPQEPHRLALDHLHRGRSAVRLRRVRAHHHQLVHAGDRVGRVEGDAPLHREQARPLRGMEPHVDGLRYRAGAMGMPSCPRDR